MRCTCAPGACRTPLQDCGRRIDRGADMSDKPSYLGLLNAVSLAETAATST